MDIDTSYLEDCSFEQTCPKKKLRASARFVNIKDTLENDFLQVAMLLFENVHSEIVQNFLNKTYTIEAQIIKILNNPRKSLKRSSSTPFLGHTIKYLVRLPNAPKNVILVIKRCKHVLRVEQKYLIQNIALRKIKRDPIILWSTPLSTIMKIREKKELKPIPFREILTIPIPDSLLEDKKANLYNADVVSSFACSIKGILKAKILGVNFNWSLNGESGANDSIYSNSKYETLIITIADVDNEFSTIKFYLSVYKNSVYDVESLILASNRITIENPFIKVSGRFDLYLKGYYDKKTVIFTDEMDDDYYTPMLFSKKQTFLIQIDPKQLVRHPIKLNVTVMSIIYFMIKLFCPLCKNYLISDQANPFHICSLKTPPVYKTTICFLVDDGTSKAKLYLNDSTLFFRVFRVDPELEKRIKRCIEIDGELFYKKGMISSSQPGTIAQNLLKNMGTATYSVIGIPMCKFYNKQKDQTYDERVSIYRPSFIKANKKFNIFLNGDSYKGPGEGSFERCTYCLEVKDMQLADYLQEFNNLKMS